MCGHLCVRAAKAHWCDDGGAKAANLNRSRKRRKADSQLEDSSRFAADIIGGFPFTNVSALIACIPILHTEGLEYSSDVYTGQCSASKLHTFVSMILWSSHFICSET